VPFDDAAAQRQTDAGALELVAAVQALEHPEQAVGTPGVEPDAVVLHPEHAFSGCRVGLPAHRHRGRLAWAAVLEGVGQQVVPHLAEQQSVTLNLREVRGQFPAHRLRRAVQRRVVLHAVHAGLQQGAHRNALALQGRPAQA